MAEKASIVSKRQAVLLDRLATFCDRCGSPDLPVQVSEVIGYGSFFRGKESPNDIDAVVVAPEDHPLFEKFIAIVRDQISRMHVASPAEEMLRIAAEHPDPQVAGSARLFSDWLKGMSFETLFEARNILQQMTRYEALRFAERILGDGLPRIRFHVHRRDDFTTAKVKHVVWTPDRPDVGANVEAIWGSDNRDALRVEADWFEKQVRHYLLINEVLVRAIRRLASDDINVRGKSVEEKIQKWATRTDIGFPNELVSDLLRGRLSLGEDLPNPPGYKEPRFGAMDVDALGAEVEEKRKSLRGLMDRERVLSVIARCLMHRQFVDRKALRRPLRDFLQGAIEERMYRRELNMKRMQAIIETEVESVLSTQAC
jgi:hypothetical protein